MNPSSRMLRRRKMPSFSKKLCWVPASNGYVPSGAIVGGTEQSNPMTFIGRVYLKGKYYMGRIVPGQKYCYVTRNAMEHRRSTYEVLVNRSEEILVWKAEYQGHVPDTAIEFSLATIGAPSSSKDKSEAEEEEATYIGRASFSKNTVVPGQIIPSHGALHCGHDNVETTKDEYEVLCRNNANSLVYLAAKRIRDMVRARNRHHISKYLMKLTNMLLSIERIIFTVIRKEPRKRESCEHKLQLPKTLVSYIVSPKRQGFQVQQRLDFNTIMANCCPPEANCCCQMWVEVTLQGLY